jgi:hypothetical protein
MAVPTLTAMTPPKVQGNSWLGVDPKQKLSAATAQRGLEGYLGGAGTLAPHMDRIKGTLAKYGYNDTNFASDLTGEQYNALLQEGAGATGNTYTPYSTVGGGLEGTQPVPPPPGTTAPGAAAPDLNISEYKSPDAFKFDAAAFEQDPSYRWRVAEGQRAAENMASKMGNARGGNFMTALTEYGQNAGRQEFGAAFDRAAQTDAINRGEHRFGYEQDVNRSQLQYAPKLATWGRDRDEQQRQRELDFDRDWQKEVYGRDDAWRRHQYANDDLWRRYQLEEDRRMGLAGMGRV